MALGHRKMQHLACKEWYKPTSCFVRSSGLDWQACAKGTMSVPRCRALRTNHVLATCKEAICTVSVDPHGTILQVTALAHCDNIVAYFAFFDNIAELFP